MRWAPATLQVTPHRALRSRPAIWRRRRFPALFSRNHKCRELRMRVLQRRSARIRCWLPRTGAMSRLRRLQPQTPRVRRILRGRLHSLICSCASRPAGQSHSALRTFHRPSPPLPRRLLLPQIRRPPTHPRRLINVLLVKFIAGRPSRWAYWPCRDQDQRVADPTNGCITIFPEPAIRCLLECGSSPAHFRPTSSRE